MKKKKGFEQVGEIAKIVDKGDVSNMKDFFGEPIFKELKTWVFFFKEMNPGEMFQNWIVCPEEQFEKIVDYLRVELKAAVRSFNFNAGLFSELKGEAEQNSNENLIFLVRNFEKEKTFLTGHGYNQTISELFQEDGGGVLKDKKLMILHHLSPDKDGYQENLREAASSQFKFSLLVLEKDK